MKKSIAVARWEYLEKVKSKAFLISLLLTPVIMILVAVVPALLALRTDTETKVIGVIDLSGDMTTPLSELLQTRYKLPNGEPNYLLRPIHIDDPIDALEAKKAADSLVLMEEIEGVLILGRSIMDDSVVEYRSQNIGNIKVTERMIAAVRDLVVERKLAGQGVDPSFVKELTRPLAMRTIKLTKSGREEEAGFGQLFFTSYIFMMMLFFLVNTSGQLLIRSMLEEKSNRIVEVLMSSCSAKDLMTGKIIGLSGLGLTQLAVWLVIGLSISIRFSMPMIPATSALLLLIYFVLGYIMYAGIFVAAGSPISTEHEAQQINTYLALIMVLPIVVSFMIIQDPNSTFAKILSLIPFLTPSMMAIRIPIQIPSTLELVVSMTLVGLTALTMIWIASRVFRVAILSYGKRPRVGELFQLLFAK